MEDTFSGSLDPGENSDNEDIVTWKRKKSHGFLDEVLRDITDTVLPQRKQEQTPADVLDAIRMDSPDEIKVDIKSTTVRKKKVKRPVSSDSSDNEDNITVMDSIKKNAKKSGIEDIFATEKNSNDEEKMNSVHEDVEMNARILNTTDDAVNTADDAVNTADDAVNTADDAVSTADDAVSTADDAVNTADDAVNTADDAVKTVDTVKRSDMENSDCSDSAESVSRSCNNSVQGDDDEGFDESSLDPKLLAKLKKGAAKKTKKGQSGRNKNDKVSLHSETQRIIRESHVSIPYHQPAPKPLNYFLENAIRKQQCYKVLKGSTESRKAELMMDILQKTRIESKMQKELDKDNDSDEDWTPDDEKCKNLKKRIDDKMNVNPKDQEHTNIANGCLDNEDSAAGSQMNIVKSGADYVTAKTKVVDKTSLPDLESSTDTLQRVEEWVNNSKEFENEGKSDCVTNSVNSGMIFPPVLSEWDRTVSDQVEHNTNVDEVLYEWEKTAMPNDDIAADNSENMEDNNSNETNDLVTGSQTKIDTSLQRNYEESKKLHHNLTDNKMSLSSSKMSVSKLNANRMAVFAGIDLDSMKPCLSGTVEHFITLEEADVLPKHPGIQNLMNRLHRHSSTNEKSLNKDTDISIVSKDKVGIDKEELSLKTFSYHAEKGSSSKGLNLSELKEELQKKIKEQRKIKQSNLEAMINLDNEEGDAEEDPEEEEMSEHTDTDIDEDEENDSEDAYDEEMDESAEAKSKSSKVKSQYVDDEAEDDDEDASDEDASDEDASDSEDDDDGNNGDIEDGDENEVNKEGDQDDDMNLKLYVSDESGTDGEDEKENDDNSDNIGKVLTTAQRPNDSTEDFQRAKFRESVRQNEPERPRSSFGGNADLQTQIESAQKKFSLPMPIEDSQDLYGSDTSHVNTVKQKQHSQHFPFSLEDSQSNVLDAECCNTQTTRRKDLTQHSSGARRAPATNSGPSTQYMNELFQDSTLNKAARKSLFEENEVQDTQKAMEEFLDLCSGVFTDTNRNDEQNKTGTQHKIPGGDSDNEGSIRVLSENGDLVSDVSDNEDEDFEDIDHVEDDANDEENPQRCTGFTVKNKHGKIRPEFIDAEAELSGSEVDSDENFDLAEEDDILEIEDGDRDFAQMDPEKLQNEVSRVHLKQMIDDDKRELLRYQERYLPDGDLFSEGGGRARKFRWSNIDNDTQQDMFGDGSDGEADPEEVDDFEWRKTRYERDQFVEGQQEKENLDTENSDILRLGKVFLKKQVSVDSSGGDKSIKPQAVSNVQSTASAETYGLAGSFYKIPQQKRGSFLARSKEDLAKIAERNKPVSNPSAGANTKGNFTFKVSEKITETEVPDKSKKRKSHVPNKSVIETSANVPAFKKPKLDSQKSFTTNSIFNHI